MKYELDFGFLNIYKPSGCTSSDVVVHLRKTLEIRKIGHSGTLDPFATGVLVIGINEATRLFDYLPSDKVYLVEITFGIQTNTDDITGEVTNSSSRIPVLAEIKEKLSSFTGRIKQKPPIFSAIKINGNRAYKLARKNEISLADIKEKEIEIYSIDIISHIDNKIKLKIHCSSGTYIRSIARDLGNELKTCATLSSLQRDKIGEFFTIQNSLDIKCLSKENIKGFLIMPHKVIKAEKVYLSSGQIENVRHGQVVELQDQNITKSTNEVQILSNNERFIGIGQIINGNFVKPVKVLIR